MSNKLYDILKYCVTIIFPAIVTFAGVIMQTFNYEYTQQVLVIATGFITCLGTCLGVSTYNYNKSKEGE